MESLTRSITTIRFRTTSVTFFISSATNQPLRLHDSSPRGKCVSSENEKHGALASNVACSRVALKFARLRHLPPGCRFQARTSSTPRNPGGSESPETSAGRYRRPQPSAEWHRQSDQARPPLGQDSKSRGLSLANARSLATRGQVVVFPHGAGSARPSGPERSARVSGLRTRRTVATPQFAIA